MSLKQKTVGVFTGGGDVPGLNPALKTLVNHAIDKGFRVLGIRRGWGGLLNYNHDDPESLGNNIVALDRRAVRTVDRTGGTFLHTSRTNPGNVRKEELPSFLTTKGYEITDKGTYDCTQHILANIERLGIDALIPIGGDDTLSYAERLHREGVPVVAIPKTMDDSSAEFVGRVQKSFGPPSRISLFTAIFFSVRPARKIAAARNSASLRSAILAGVYSPPWRKQPQSTSRPRTMVDAKATINKRFIAIMMHAAALIR